MLQILDAFIWQGLIVWQHDFYSMPSFNAGSR